jgi:UDP-glucose 4-epimerase
MTVLVTGGAGYIGSHMVHALADAGEGVVVLDDLSTGIRELVPAPVPLFVGDAGDQNLVRAIASAHAVDAIIHFAGSVIVPESVRDPLLYYRNNTATTRNLLEAAMTAGIRNFVFSSSAAVYGNADTNPVAEDAPTRPLSPYGTSKLMSEIMLHDVAAASDLRYVVLRYFNVAGADPHTRTGQSTPQATHLIKVAVETAVGERTHVEIFGTDYPTRDGTCIRDFIHVSDLADAHLASLAYLRQGGTSATFNCGYGRGFSVLEVVEAVRRAAGRQIPVRHGARRAGDPVELIADARQLRATLRWTPKFDDIDTIVAHALAWERRQYARDEPPAAVPA